MLNPTLRIFRRGFPNKFIPLKQVTQKGSLIRAVLIFGGCDQTSGSQKASAPTGPRNAVGVQPVKRP